MKYDRLIGLAIFNAWTFVALLLAILLGYEPPKWVAAGSAFFGMLYACSAAAWEWLYRRRQEIG